MTETTTEYRVGVQCSKYIEKDDYDLPSVVYEFTSERDHDISIQVVESTHGELKSDHIGTHRDFKPETWDVIDDGFAFELDLEPETNRKVVFALRPPAADEIDQIEGTPEEFTVTPEREAPVNGVSSVSDPSTTNPPGSQGPTLLDQPNANATGTGGGGNRSKTNGTGRTTTRSAESTSNDGDRGTESVVTRFVEELRAGRVSAEEMTYLEERFGSTRSTPNTVDTRIKQLQQDFADLRAYTSALEEFLDENGSGREVLDSLEARLESVESEIDSLDSTVTAHGEELSTLRENQQRVRSSTNELSTTVDSLEDDLEAVSSVVDDVDDQIPAYDIDERFSALEGDVADTIGFISRLQGVLEEDWNQNPE